MKKLFLAVVGVLVFSCPAWARIYQAGGNIDSLAAWRVCVVENGSDYIIRGLIFRVERERFDYYSDWEYSLRYSLEYSSYYLPYGYDSIQNNREFEKRTLVASFLLKPGQSLVVWTDQPGDFLALFGAWGRDRAGWYKVGEFSRRFSLEPSRIRNIRLVGEKMRVGEIIVLKNSFFRR